MLRRGLFHYATCTSHPGSMEVLRKSASGREGGRKGKGRKRGQKRTAGIEEIKLGRGWLVTLQCKLGGKKKESENVCVCLFVMSLWG